MSFVETWQALVERGNAGLVDYATKLDNTLTEIAAWQSRIWLRWDGHRFGEVPSVFQVSYFSENTWDRPGKSWFLRFQKNPGFIIFPLKKLPMDGGHFTGVWSYRNVTMEWWELQIGIIPKWPYDSSYFLVSESIYIYICVCVYQPEYGFEPRWWYSWWSDSLVLWGK